MQYGPAIRSHIFLALSLSAIVSLGLLSAISSGGGGGGGDGDGDTDDPAPPFPSVVKYTAGTPTDFSGSGVDIALEGGGTVHAGFYLEGSYAKTPRAYSLEPHTVPRINVTTSGLPYTLIYPNFGILIEQTLQWERGKHPTAGQFRTVPAGTVRLTVTANAGGSGQPGVDIAWIDADVTLGSASLTWSQLDAVLDDPEASDNYVVQAAFVYRVFQWVYDQIQLGMDGIEFVSLNDPALVAAGSGVGIDQSCDLFPYDGSTGYFHFTWSDGPGEQEDALGAGDNFATSYHDCWRDEPGQADVWVTSGGADLLGRWEDPATIALGYDSMVFHDVAETATSQAGVTPTLGDTITVNSFGIGGQEGFRLITEPDTSASINVTNAQDVAVAGVAALLLPRQVGDLSLGILSGFVADPSFLFCDMGGSMSISPTPTATTAVPATFAVSFTACQREPADPVTLDGSVTLNVESVSGGTMAALTTDDFSASLEVENIAMDLVDSVGSSNISGGSHFSRTAVAGDYTESSASVAGGLTIAEGGVTSLLQPYQLASTLATSGAYSLGAAGDTLTVSVSNLSGALTLTVLQPVQGTDLSAPVSGKLRIAALDGSTLTATVVSGNVTLELDSNGDGTVDDTLMTTWADLN